MKQALSIITALGIIIAIASCKDKCYDCTLKCGTCTKQGVTVAGCDGDSALQGYSVDTWRVGLEAQCFTCAYNNVEEEVCGDDHQKTFEGDDYTWLSQ